jgi:hypothetical protein
MSFLLKEDGDRLLKEDGGGILLDFIAIPVVVFPTLPPTLASVLAGSHTPVSKVEFLDSDWTVLYTATGYLVDGSVSKDRSRDSHASASIILVDTDGTLRPRDSGSLVWPNRLVRISRGAVVGSTAQYVELLTGVIDEPGEGHSEGQVSFAVHSRLTLLDVQFSLPVTYPAGQLISEVVREVAESAGFGTEDERYDLEGGGVVLSSALTYDVGANMLQSVVKLAFDAGLDLWDTGSGVLTLRPFTDPALAPIAWDFVPGVNGVLTKLNRKLRALRVYNRQVVEGIGPDGYPIRAVAVVTNPSDPLLWSMTNDRPAPVYFSPNITTQAMANSVAARLLYEGALYEESLAGTTVPIPLLSDRDVVRFAGAGVDDSFLLDSVTIPLAKGQMQMQTRRVRSLIE